MAAVLVVIAHGSRIDAANLEFIEVVSTIDYAALGYDRIAAAFLEAASPSLEQAVAHIDEQIGASSIDVYPLFFNKGRHVEQDLPSLVQGLRSQHSHIEFRLLPYFGAYPALGRVVADHIRTVDA